MGKELNFDKLPTIPEVIAGRAQGRQRDEEVTCFLNNIGLGYQFAAAGAVVWRKARAAGSATSCRPSGSPRTCIHSARQASACAFVRAVTAPPAEMIERLVGALAIFLVQVLKLLL